MLPLAPGLLSTITDAPQRSPSFCPARRARMSGPVPREYGTTMVMILPGAGYDGCACAAAAGRSRPAASVKCGRNLSAIGSARAHERAKKASVLASMLWRGGAPAGVLGSLNEL